MATPGSFVHLHCHTHYSLLDGASRIPELVAHVKGLGMNSVAITDHGNLYGAIEFYRECTAAGINPVIGYEAYVAPGKRTEREAKKRGDAGFHLTLLAQNATGFKNLIKLASYAFTEGYYYVPRIDKELLEAHKEGLICLSGCASSEFSEFILRDQLDEATRIAETFAKLFGKNFYIEIQANGLEIQRLCAEGAIDVANRLGLPLVATSDAHYLNQEDAPAHDVLLCINTKAKRSDVKRMRYGNGDGQMVDQFYVRGPKEMYGLFPGHAEAVQRSQEIADGVDIKLDFKKRHFPVYVPPEGKTPEDYLRELCTKGLAERYGDNPSQQVLDRLEHELGIICRMGFASYFLIVGDFVRFAEENSIPTTARGSACGAMVSYVLKLSHVCPLEYDLLFERFLDPNRAEAPDIDIDFCQDRREKVIQYVREKYGADSVAQIATFGTMAAKAAIKDVGRVLDIPLERVIQLTNMVPKTLNITLEESLEQSADLRQAYESDPDVHELLDIAMKLEGTNRNSGTHAAGVVIGAGPLVNYVPLMRPSRRDDTNSDGNTSLVTQWVMGDLEKVGLLKMDFLGLRTLTLLDNAVRMIQKTRGIKIDLQALPLDDPETYLLLQRGDAKGVFQLESDGMRELLKRMKPDNIRDLIAILALYRPGPLEGGMVDSYVNCKHGRETPTYAHPVMKEILEETHGVMCIHEDTRIALADGSEKPIRDIRIGDMVHSLNETTRRFVARECHGCGPTRREDGLRLTLENGFSVVLTDDHKVLTYHGMKEVGLLDPETDLIAAGVNMPQFGPRKAALAPWLGNDEDVAYFLGLLVGDGCLTGTSITIATGTQENHDKLVAWFGERLPSLQLHGYHHCRSWYLAIKHPELLNDPAHGNRKTRLHHFIESMGLKVKAARKKVPAPIFTAPSSVRAAFLAGLFDTDGCLAKTNTNTSLAFVTTISPTLREDLRRLGQLEGLPVHVSRVRVHFWNTVALEQLLLPYLQLKEFKGRRGTGAGLGWVPAQGGHAAITTASVATPQATTCAVRTTVFRLPVWKSAKAAKAGIKLGDVRYHCIKSIERVHDQQFYGMSVDEHHNLVASGVVVSNCYQEQIMRILNRLGGIELSSAYACIKAISKKKTEIIDQRRVEFLKGSVERGVPHETAEEIFRMITVFGGYGFNKSHTAAYAKVGYQTAYLKTHFRPEFMAALLSSEVDDGNKRDILVEHIADARRLGVEVLPPNVNTSESDFSVQGGKIVFGLTAIKGCGRQAAEELVRVREESGTKYRDIFDLCERVDLKVCKPTSLEKLIKAGALDCFFLHRAQLLHVLPRAIQAATQRQKDRATGQGSLFADLTPVEVVPTVTNENVGDVPAWSETEKLKNEKEVLDFYFSSHPLAQHEKELRRYATHAVEQIKKAPADEEVLIGGMLTLVRLMNYKKPKAGPSRYMRCKVEDLTGTVECVMWAKEYDRFKDEIADDRIVLVKGSVERAREEPSLVLSRIISIQEAAKEMARNLNLLMIHGKARPVEIDALAEILRRTPGPCPVQLVLRDAQGRRVVLRLSRQFAINPQTFEQEALEALLGPGSVKLT